MICHPIESVMFVDMRSGPLDKRIPFATDDEQLKLLDEWRRQQPDLPTRSEAVRRILDLVLRQREIPNAEKPE